MVALGRTDKTSLTWAGAKLELRSQILLKNINAYDVDAVSLKNFEAFDKAMQAEDIKAANVAKAGLPA